MPAQLWKKSVKPVAARQSARTTLSAHMGPIAAGAQICSCFTTSDNVGLRYALWRSNSRPARGSVMILQGRTEFMEKYAEVIGDLLGRGFDVLAFDWRGQGGSERCAPDPKTGDVARFDDYLIDLTELIDHILLPDCPPPHFALAHSMGGAVVLAGGSRLATRLQRAMLLAPMVDIRLRVPRWLARTALGLKCLLADGSARFDNPFRANIPYGDELTHDEGRRTTAEAILAADPDLFIGAPSARWLRGAFGACQKFARRKFGRDIRLPMLILGAGADHIVCSKAAERLTTRSPWINYIEIAGARHELLMETDAYRVRVWTAFDQFIGE